MGWSEHVRRPGFSPGRTGHRAAAPQGAASGAGGDWFRIAVCHNKASIALYVVVFDDQGPVAERYADRLPKAKIGKSCITMKSLAGVDLDVLGEVLAEARKILGP